ncbi:MAG: hypothetical protein ACSLFK_05255 [Gemmatimonadaceae bacterium]
MDRRDRLVAAISFFGLCVVLLTEFLGALHLIARGPVTILWALAAAVALVVNRGRTPALPRLQLSIETATLAAIATITLLLGITKPIRSWRYG